MSNLQDPEIQKLLLDDSSILDTQHHDVPERHQYGGAFLEPQLPQIVGPGLIASAGESSAPARADHVHGYIDGTWQTWTPRITGVTTDPVLGSGANQQGRYYKLNRLVIAQFRIDVGGAGFSPGSGIYEFTLPIMSAATGIAFPVVGTCYEYQVSSGAIVFGFLTMQSQLAMRFNYPFTWPTGVLQQMSATVPWTHGQNNSFTGQMIYESPN